MSNTICKTFYRVNVQLMDDEDPVHVSFDFYNIQDAALFADEAYHAGDLYKVWLQIIENEVDTTNSPMRRD